MVSILDNKSSLERVIFRLDPELHSEVLVYLMKLAFIYQPSFEYIGVQIFKGKHKQRHFGEICDRIKVKLATWKGVLLSSMGRVWLIKSINHRMFIYSFNIYLWPMKLLKQIDG